MEASIEKRKKAPIWFRVVAVLALAWNAIGVIDYYNSMSLNEEYLANIPGALEFVTLMPIWVKIVWGAAIAGSILGSICLLLRKSWALPLFCLAIIGMIISFGYQFTAENKPQVSTVMHVFTGLIWVVALFLVWFSKYAKSKSWLI